MDIGAYLKRIAYTKRPGSDLETLSELHRAHLMAAPFENLDIHLGRRILIARDKQFKKIVTENRGGFCYELNGLFGALLERLGFPVSLLSARVHSDGRPGPEFDLPTV